MKTLRTRLTFANVTSCLALFVALGGLAVAAGLPKNSVGSKQLKANSVITGKIKNAAVTGAKVKTSTLGTVPSAASAQSLDGMSADQSNKARSCAALPERSWPAASASRPRSEKPSTTRPSTSAGGRTAVFPTLGSWLPFC